MLLEPEPLSPAPHLILCHHVSDGVRFPPRINQHDGHRPPVIGPLHLPAMVEFLHEFTGRLTQCHRQVPSQFLVDQLEPIIDAQRLPILPPACHPPVQLPVPHVHTSRQNPHITGHHTTAPLTLTVHNHLEVQWLNLLLLRFGWQTPRPLQQLLFCVLLVDFFESCPPLIQPHDASRGKGVGRCRIPKTTRPGFLNRPCDCPV